MTAHTTRHKIRPDALSHTTIAGGVCLTLFLLALVLALVTPRQVLSVDYSTY